MKQIGKGSVFEALSYHLSFLVWNLLPTKPEWLTYEDIEEYERKMLNASPDDSFNDVIIPDELKDEYTTRYEDENI